MKYIIFILFLASPNIFAAEYAEMKIEYKTTTRDPQIFLLKKEKEGVYCSIPNRSWRKVKAKDLKFPLKDMKSTELCEKVVTWTYKKKKEQSCVLKTDLVIDDIIFACLN